MKTPERMKLISLQMKDLSDAVADRDKAIKQHAGGVPYWQLCIPPRAKKEAIKRRVMQIRQDLMELTRELNEYETF